MSKQEALRAIHEKWFAECECGLKASATQPVPGDGNPAAEIVFIGEAPGKDEDIQGKPFVGSAGKFLNEMLQEINLKRENVYITNIVKYRPPGNRDPEPEEKESCIKWLQEELGAIKPKLIVFLGRHSMNYFFPAEKISTVHGKMLVKKIPNLPTKYFLALYHPAAALYNGGMRETLKADFKKIPKILEKIKSSDTLEK
jgi:DNA polymerase